MAEKQKRGARGAGTIRQRPDGRWEARFVTGVDPGTGKDIRRSVYASTQREARKKMTEAISALDRGTYKEPCRMTLGQWLDIWTAEYLNSVKPKTLEAYLCIIKTHIRPGLGAVRLYEQLVLQKVSVGEYKKQAAVIDRELEQLRAIHSHLKAQISQMEMDEKAKASRTDLARQAAESDGLTAQLADALIERAYVYPGDQVEIIWKTKDFIGMEQ